MTEPRYDPRAVRRYRASRLSEMQYELLHLLAEDRTPMEAAGIMGIPYKNVTSALVRARQKLGVKTTIRAVLMTVLLREPKIQGR